MAALAQNREMCIEKAYYSSKRQQKLSSKHMKGNLLAIYSFGEVTSVTN